MTIEEILESPTNVFEPGCTVECMQYIDRKVYCGTKNVIGGERTGYLLVYGKNNGK